MSRFFSKAWTFPLRSAASSGPPKRLLTRAPRTRIACSWESDLKVAKVIPDQSRGPSNGWATAMGSRSPSARTARPVTRRRSRPVVIWRGMPLPMTACCSGKLSISIGAVSAWKLRTPSVSKIRVPTNPRSKAPAATPCTTCCSASGASYPTKGVTSMRTFPPDSWFTLFSR